MELPMDWVETPESPCECYVGGGEHIACEVHLKAALGNLYEPGRKTKDERRAVVATGVAGNRWK